MHDLVLSLSAAVGVFVGTNIDDIVVLTLLFLASNASGRPKIWQIVAGQYTGIAVLVGLSVVGALGLTLLPNEWVGLFGLIPLALGIRGLIQAIRERGRSTKTPPVTATGFIAVAGITIANGGDNIAIYTPYFHSLNSGGVAAAIAVFAVLVGVWCGAAYLLGKHKHLVRLINQFGHWIVPFVFIGIGLMILWELV